MAFRFVTRVPLMDQKSRRPLFQRVYTVPRFTCSTLEASVAVKSLISDSDILARVDDLVSWAEDIKAYALEAAIGGKHWAGWKLVEGRSNRRYTDEQAVAEAVLAAGKDPYERSVLGITAMTKLLGRKQFDEILGNLVEKPQGKPALVPESDKRPALTNSDFDNEEGE